MIGIFIIILDMWPFCLSTPNVGDYVFLGKNISIVLAVDDARYQATLKLDI